MELAVEKYQNSVSVASKKSFYVRKQRDKTIEHKLAPWLSMELTLMRKNNVLHTQCKQKTCNGVTHTSQAGAHDTPNKNPYPYQ